MKIFTVNKRTPAPSGGTIGPLVAFEATTDYISALPTITETTEATIVFRLRLDEEPAFLDYMFGFFFGGMQFENVGGVEKGMFVNFTTTSFSSVFISQTATTWGDGDVMAVHVAMDTASGLTGGRCVSVYVNGSEILSSTDAISGNWRWNDGSQPFHFMQNAAADGTVCGASCNGLWISNQALDPATFYSDFFDGSNQFQALSTAGTVGGVTPDFWQNGDATAWNSGTDNNSNSYTMTGAVS